MSGSSTKCFSVVAWCVSAAVESIQFIGRGEKLKFFSGF